MGKNHLYADERTKTSQAAQNNKHTKFERKIAALGPCFPTERLDPDWGSRAIKAVNIVGYNKKQLRWVAKRKLALPLIIGETQMIEREHAFITMETCQTATRVFVKCRCWRCCCRCCGLVMHDTG